MACGPLTDHNRPPLLGPLPLTPWPLTPCPSPPGPHPRARSAYSDLGPQACSNVLSSCARLGHAPRELLHHLTGAMAEPGVARSARCLHLASSLMALGRLRSESGHKPRAEHLRQLLGEVAARLPAAPGEAAAGRGGGGSGLS